jgi:hypothetical protein
MLFTIPNNMDGDGGFADRVNNMADMSGGESFYGNENPEAVDYWLAQQELARLQDTESVRNLYRINPNYFGI